MGIENLLAQGVQIRPAGMERNALMQAQEFKDRQQRNALMQMQMEDVHAQRQLAIQQAQQVAADRARSEQFRQSIPSPQMQASQQALAGGGGPTVGNAAQMRPVDPRLQALHGAMRAWMVTPMDYINAVNPEAKFETVAPGASRVNSRTNQVVFTAPDKAKLPDGMRMGQNGPEWIPGYLDGRGQIARSGASSIVNYGSPVPVQLPDGSTGYVQPSNRGGAASPMLTPDGKPLVKPAGSEKDPTEGERKAATLMQRLRGSQAQLSAAIKTTPDAAKPRVGSELARKVAGDTAANLAMSEARQQVEAAQLDMLDAALTLSTGAAYTKEQLQGHRRAYFPQIGDDQKTVADKQVRLKNVISAAEIAAGRAAKSVPKFDDAPGATVQTATNPKTCEKLQLVNGQWVPAK